MDLRQFFGDNSVGIVVGIVATLATSALVRGIILVVRVIRMFGLRSLGQAFRESVLHLTAYPKIKADPVLSIGYVSIHMALLVVNATVFIFCALVALSGLAVPLWLRLLAGVIALVAAFRVAKRAFVVASFYASTAGPVIEEVKKSSWLLNGWDKRKKGEPLIQFGTAQGAAKKNEPSIEPKTVPPTPPAPLSTNPFQIKTSDDAKN